MNDKINASIDQQSSFADFLYMMGDVAAGKISFDEAVKELNTRDRERAKRLIEVTKQAYETLKKSIAERKRELDINAKYDMSHSLRINEDGKTSYIGLKPKNKEPWYKRITHNAGRSIKRFGELLTGEKTFRQVSNEEINDFTENLSNNSNIFRGVRATVEGINSAGKTIKQLRGLSPETTRKNKNPYDNLKDEQFPAALHAAYYNIVRMEHFGKTMPDAEKDKAISEINLLMESAQKRYPDTKAANAGTYFTDPKLQNIEAQLFAYMKENSIQTPDDNIIKEDIQRYEVWRHGKKFSRPLGNGTYEEEPFHNRALFISRQPDTDKPIYTAKDHLFNPLQKGKNIMSNEELAAEKAKVERLKIR